MPSTRRPILAALVCLSLGGGCGDEHAHEHEGEDHDHAPGDAAHGHVHEAPHGGTLVVLADESVNLELVLDPAAGKLTAFVLDGHAERGLRVAQPSISMALRRGAGDPFDVTLVAVANPLTGETAGDTSEFAATDERLRGPGPIDGVVRSVAVRGTAFADVSFRLPEATR